MDCVDQSLTKAQIEEQLKEKLNKAGIMSIDQYDQLDMKDKSLLMEVYSVIKSKQDKRAGVIKTFKEQAITKKAVADSIKSSRRTLYNKDFAMALIEKLQADDAEKDPFNRIEVLEDRIGQLTQMVEKMQVRDVVIETLTLEIKKINDEITQKIQAYNTLEDENFKLLRRINELQGLETKLIKMPKNIKNC